MEMEGINRSSGKLFSAVNLASRQYLCLNEKCRNLSAVEALEACQLLKDAGKCPYKTEIELPDPTLPLVLSISRLKRHGLARVVCPYFLARKAAEYCTVIVAPYQYIFNEHIRRRIKLELGDKVLVFDEAHNADQIGQDALSDTLSERTLSSARKELEAVQASTDLIDSLAVYLGEKVSGNSVAKLGFELRVDLEHVLGTSDFSSFVDEFSNLGEEIRTLKMEQGDFPVCFLNGVLDFLELVGSGSGENYVAVYRRSFQGFNVLEYRCLDPSLAIKPVVSEALGALVMSGTLSPLDLFAETLGLEEAEKRTYSAIVDPENVRTVIDASVTTKFSERSEDMICRYGEKVSKLIGKIPNGVLIFFPQRKLMVESLQTWRKIKVIGQAQARPFLGGKPLFTEGDRATENRKIVEEYKNAARSETGAVLCCVFRGRNAEGSNFPYEEARGVFLIGVPYADYSDPVVKTQIGYYNNKRKGMGERWYLMDAFRAANQAIGRGIRHRDDWCNFILMDSRYESHKNLISKWAIASGIHKFS
jgi:Rad3-related DNA helicase